MASIYKRGRYYWVTFYLHGKKIHQSLKVKDWKLAEHLRKKKEIEVEEGKTYPISNIKWSDFLKEYKSYSETIKSPNSNSRESYTIDLFSTWANINRLKDINIRLLREYINYRREKDNLSPGTLNKFISIIKAMLNYAVSQKYLIDSPAKELKKIRETKNPPRFLSKEEIHQLLDAAKESYLYPMIATGIYAGLRLGELINLEWQDFDFDKGTLTVTNKHELNFKTKSKQFRVIPLHKSLIGLLQPYNHRNGLCFLTHEGEKLAGSPRKAFTRIIKKVGLKGVGWHTLRHTFASHLVMKGVDLTTVSKLLGHSSIITTMIYAHLSQPHIKEAVNRLDF